MYFVRIIIVLLVTAQITCNTIKCGRCQWWKCPLIPSLLCQGEFRFNNSYDTFLMLYEKYMVALDPFLCIVSKE